VADASRGYAVSRARLEAMSEAILSATVLCLS
jgi:hypothetical protein